jgi:hypothetical protein
MQYQTNNQASGTFSSHFAILDSRLLSSVFLRVLCGFGFVFVFANCQMPIAANCQLPIANCLLPSRLAFAKQLIESFRQPANLLHSAE